MRCPFCDSSKSKIISTKLTLVGTKRSRECLRCGLSFTTCEKVHVVPPVVIKRDGRREAYSSDKVKSSVLIACKKRPISIDAIDDLIEEVEFALFKLGSSEVQSATIGEMVIDQLLALDKIAHIRYASIYYNFAKIESFVEIANSAKNPQPPKGQIMLFKTDEKKSSKKLSKQFTGRKLN